TVHTFVDAHDGVMYGEGMGIKPVDPSTCGTLPTLEFAHVVTARDQYGTVSLYFFQGQSGGFTVDDNFVLSSTANMSGYLTNTRPGLTNADYSGGAVAAVYVERDPAEYYFDIPNTSWPQPFWMNIPPFTNTRF